MFYRIQSDCNKINYKFKKYFNFYLLYIDKLLCTLSTNREIIKDKSYELSGTKFEFNEVF